MKNAKSEIKTATVKAIETVQPFTAPVLDGSGKTFDAVPARTFGKVKVSDLDVSHNTRSDTGEITSKAAIATLRSLALNGQNPSMPLTVNRVTLADGTVKHFVIRGSCRARYMAILSDGSSTLPDGIPHRSFDYADCIICDNLPRDIEDRMRADHIGEKDLSDWDVYTETVRLFEAGLNRYQVAATMGRFEHGTAERLYYRHIMPPEVEADYRAKCDGLDNLKLKNEDIKNLYTAWSADAIVMGSRKPAIFGPLSAKLWAEFKNRESKPKAAKSSRVKDADIANVIKQYADECPLAVEILKWGMGDKSINLAQTIATINGLFETIAKQDTVIKGLRADIKGMGHTSPARVRNGR